jgi:hypothetical protein
MGPGHSDRRDTSETAIVVRQLARTDMPAWQRFVDAIPQAGPLHHVGWYDVLCDAYGVTPYFLMATAEGGEIDGILPLYHSTSMFTGSHLSSLEGGVLARNMAAAARLIGQARSLCEQIGARYVQFRGGMTDDAAAVVVPTVHTIVVTDQPADIIWQRMKQSGRRGVRKGEREDVTVARDIDLGHLEEFYWLYAAHMRGLGTPVMGIEAFRAMRRHLGAERLRLYIVRLQQQVVGGMLCLVNASQWTSYFAATQTPEAAEFANYSLYWHVVRDAAALGVSRFDLGRSTPGSTVHIFKQRWGGADVEVPYSFYPRPGIVLGDVGLYQRAPGKGLRQQVWSRLPPSVCNRLGPLLRKQLPFI